MRDDPGERREAAVVIEAALCVRPQALQRRGAVMAIRRALRLEAVDADLVRRVHVPARFGVERRHVAARAVRLAGEKLPASMR